MKRLFFALILVSSFNLSALELKVGDILLQPLDCWSCSLIEAQENSIYSHMGMVIQTRPEVIVVEALGTVRALSLREFNSRTQRDQKLSVRRLQNGYAVQYIQRRKDAFLEMFRKEYEGLKYDHDFLWNNYDDNGQEKLYCSEMVTKFLHAFLGIEIPMKIMKFDKNRDQWIRYFRGDPPDGRWGNSPASFEQSELFYEVGQL